MRSGVRRPTHVQLLPPVARAARLRAGQLGLRQSQYFAILLRNAVYSGYPEIADLPEGESPPGPKVRERLPFSIASSLQDDAGKFARKRGGTIPRLVEMLVIDDLKSSESGLTILLAAGEKKPPLH